ncbi:hypothetical protein [uncultured Nonlabens sp.]|uniref:hypothetical protein n=1 Tax=uncultured Nonlabens sp. TaxID=859306 RepID=UPI0026267EAC|nr:hypothetical protein [uncultured Nonlabens sp.]
MKTFLLFILFILGSWQFSNANKIKTIHIFVALCDNVNQGIAPVPEKIGNGQDAFNNSY